MNVFVSNLHIKKTLPLNELDLYCLDNAGTWGNLSLLMWNVGNNSLIFTLVLDLLIQKLISFPPVTNQQIQGGDQTEVLSWCDKQSENQFLWMKKQLEDFQQSGIRLVEEKEINTHYIKEAIDNDLPLITFVEDGKVGPTLLIVGYGTDEKGNLIKLYCLDGKTSMPQNSHWNACLYIMDTDEADEMVCFHSTTRKVIHLNKTVCIYK